MPTVTFLPEGRSAQVAPGASLLDAAQAAHVELPHNCGGVCACVTCHVWVEEGLQSLTAIAEGEDDKLGEAEGLSPRSRLGCQARVGSADVVVRLPGNRMVITPSSMLVMPFTTWRQTPPASRSVHSSRPSARCRASEPSPSLL